MIDTYGVVLNLFDPAKTAMAQTFIALTQKECIRDKYPAKNHATNVVGDYLTKCSHPVTVVTSRVLACRG